MSSAVARTASLAPSTWRTPSRAEPSSAASTSMRSFWPGVTARTIPILVAGRVDPPIEHDRRGRANGRGVRVGRLAELGQVADDHRGQRFDVEHRPGRRGQAGRLVRRPQGEDVPVGRRVRRSRRPPSSRAGSRPGARSRPSPPAGRRAGRPRRPPAPRRPRGDRRGGLPLDTASRRARSRSRCPRGGSPSGGHRSAAPPSRRPTRRRPARPSSGGSRGRPPSRSGHTGHRRRSAPPSCPRTGSNRRRCPPPAPRRPPASGSPGPSRTRCSPPSRRPAGAGRRRRGRGWTARRRS